MRLITFTIIVAFVLFVPNSAISGEQKREHAPFELTRSLQLVQDGIAQGNSSAFAAQRKLLRVIAKRFSAFKPDVWQDPRNARAALLLSMSGGPPWTLKSLVEKKLLPAKEMRVGKAVVAFAEGRRRRAWYLFSKIDARKVHPVLAGHIALIKGGLIAPSRPAVAFQYLSDARLFAPGTLVEEAALRRQVLLATASGHSNMLNDLTQQYIRRFVRSPYLKRFLGVYAESVVARSEMSETVQFDDVGSVLQLLPKKQRYPVLLDIARLSLARGQLSLARESAAMLAKPKHNSGGALNNRAELYQAAAKVVTDEYDESLKAISGINKKALNRQDADLRKATLMLAHAIRKWPDNVDVGASSELGKKSDEGKKGELDSLIQNANAAISGVDALLRGAL